MDTHLQTGTAPPLMNLVIQKLQSGDSENDRSIEYGDSKIYRAIESGDSEIIEQLNLAIQKL